MERSSSPKASAGRRRQAPVRLWPLGPSEGASLKRALVLSAGPLGQQDLFLSRPVPYDSTRPVATRPLSDRVSLDGTGPGCLAGLVAHFSSLG